jgi:hypothetical protein
VIAQTKEFPVRKRYQEVPVIPQDRLLSDKRNWWITDRKHTGLTGLTVVTKETGLIIWGQEDKKRETERLVSSELLRKSTKVR